MASLIAHSQEDAADSLGINVRTLQRYLKRGMPGRARKYVLGDCARWIRENTGTDESIIESLEGPEGRDLKEQLAIAKIDKTRREVEVLDRKIHVLDESLVDVDEVREIFKGSATQVKKRLSELEKKHGPDALDMVLEMLEEVELQVIQGLYDCSERETEAAS